MEGKDLRSFKDNQLYCGYLGVMPQNPQSIFLKKTVLEDLYSVIGGKKEKPSKEYSLSMKKEKAIEGIVSLTHLDGLLDRHPYDLSGGEQQRLALAKVLLLRPKDVYKRQDYCNIKKWQESHLKGKSTKYKSKDYEDNWFKNQFHLEEGQEMCIRDSEKAVKRKMMFKELTHLDMIMLKQQ